MKLQYYTSINTYTEEVRHLLDNAIEIPRVPFETDCKGECYYSTTLDGKEAYLIIEEGECFSVFY